MPTAPIRLRRWKCCLQTHGKHLHVAIERLPMPATSETTDVPKRRGDSMISILRDSGLVTLINAFSCEPTAQDALLQAWRGGEAELGHASGRRIDRATALMLRYRCDNGQWTSAVSANPLNARAKDLLVRGIFAPSWSAA